jgi:DNA-binding transcriptional MocR family regulator
MIPGRHYTKALELKTTTNICTASPNQLAIAAFLREGYFEPHLRRLRAAIHNQIESLLLSLHRHFPAETRASFPTGGASVWVELPRAINAVDFFFQARAMGIGLAPGTIFSTQEKYDNFIRLSCTGVWSPKMDEGIERLGKLAQELS